MRIVLLVCLCSLMSLSLHAQLNGNFTIGGTSPDYPTIADALNDLSTDGVNGPVTFLIRSGVYAEGIELYGPITGISAANTVTFQSEASDSTSVTINYGYSTTLVLDNLSNLIFRDLSFYSVSYEVAYLYNCQDIRFDGVSFNGDPEYTEYGLYLYENASGLQIEDMVAAGTASYGIYGESNTTSTSVSITQSRFSGGAGIFLYDFQAPEIRNNVIVPAADYENGIDLYECPEALVTENDITLALEGQQGLYIYESEYATGSGNQITITGDYATGIQLDYGSGYSSLSGNELTFTGMGGTGLYLYTGNVSITGNQFSFNAMPANYGVYIDTYDGPVHFEANRISGLTSGTGVYVSGLYSSGNGSSLFANNFIQSGGDYGIYLGGVENLDIIHNAVHQTSTDTYSAPLYLSYGTGIRIVNNIMAASGGYALYVDNDESSLAFCDYNDLYTTGSNLVRFNYNDYSDLAAWQGIGTYGQHSLNLDPLFTSASDLHSAQIGLNAAALAGQGISTDIDGDPRSPSPDIGADEFGVPGLDAAIALLSPELPLAPTELPVIITLSNTAAEVLTAVTIEWSVNGVAQPTLNWTGNLTADQFEELTLGNFTFLAGESYDLEIAITDVNGGATQITTANDLIDIQGAQTAMAGFYTIGGSDPDFSTITEAVAALYAIGVADDVIFLLRSGIYNDQIYFDGPVAGVNADRTVSFRSESMDAAAVQITFDGYPVFIDNFGYLNFSYLSLISLNEYSSVVYATGVHDLSIDNCQLIGATDNNSDIVYLGSTGNNLEFESCTFRNGYQGISVFPAGTTRGFLVNACNFSDVETAVYASNGTFSPVLTNNSMTTDGYYGVALYSPGGSPLLSGNEIVSTLASGGSAIYLNYAEGAQVMNNFITLNSSSGGQGIYSYGATGGAILHNSVNVVSGGTNTAAIQLDYGSSIQVWNNIAANFAGGVALADRYGNYTFDHNALFSTGSGLVDKDYSVLADLAAWQAASGQAGNSINTDPLFISATDLHVQAPALDGAGRTGTGVGVDIDGEARDGSMPDIGGDEFQRYPLDVALIRLAAPNPPVDPSSQPVIIELINLGTTSLTSLTIDWSVNGAAQTTLNWSGNLADGGSAEITLGNFDFSSGGTFSIEATAYNPNELPDQHPENNTLQATVETALIGIYTVGGGAADFVNISAAIEALVQRGAAGAVTFSILPGTYEEQISIGDFPGNELYPLHLRSQSLDNQTVLWQYAPTSSANYVLEINGVRDITVEGIHLKALSGASSNGTVIAMQSGDRVSLVDNWLEGHPGGSSEFRKSIIRHSNTFFDQLTVQGNLFDQGSYGLYHYNPSAQYGSQTVIENNTFQNQYSASQISYVNNVQVTGNTFTVSHSGNYLGLRVSNGQTVTANENHFQGAGNGQAIYIGNINGSAAVGKNKIFGVGSGVELQNVNSGSIINNFIQVGNSNTNAYGIRGGGGNLDILYNSVWNSSSLQSINNAALNLYSGGNHQIKNNILASTGGALVLNLSSSGTYDSDYNDLYGTGNIWGIWSNNFRYNLAEWQAASGLDEHSISEAPMFAGAADLHLSQAALNAAGTPVGVSDDIDGDPRDPVTPDIGADEFPYASDDILPLELVSAAAFCADPEFYLQVEIENQGSQVATGFDLQILEGETVLIGENAGAFSIPAGQSATYTFQTPLDLSVAGTRQLKIRTVLTGDGNPDNDELAFSLEIWALPIASASSNSPVCAGTTVQLSAGGGELYQWSGPEGFTSSSASPEILEAAESRSGSYEVTVTDGNGCQAITATEVTVNALPVATAANNGPVCVGSDLVLTAGGGESYQWSGPAGFTSAEPMPVLENILPAMAGSYTVTVTADNGCQSIAGTEVIVNQVNGSVSQNGPLCTGEELQLQAAGGTTYQWSGPDDFSSNLAEPVIGSITDAQAGLYEVTITAENGCTQVLSTNVIVHELPAAAIVPEATTICGGLPVVLTASGGQTYAWSGGDGGAEITVSPLVTTTYTVTVTNANGCRETASVTIDVENSAPYFQFTGNEGFTDAVVSPLQGSPYQTFRFEVDYFDADGDLPGASFPRLLLDHNNNGSYSDDADRIFIMTEADASDTDVTDGKRYFYQVTGLSTSMQYRTAFLAQDAAGCSSQPFVPLDEPNVVDFADIFIYANDITFSNDNPDPGTPLDVSARIHNNSDFSADNFVVRMVNQYNNTIYPDITVDQLPAHSTTTVSWTIITPEEVSWNPLQVIIDYTNVIDEPNELDNQAIRPFINGEYNLPGTILVDPQASPEVSVSGASRITVSGSAIYDGTAVPLSDPSVAGATVRFTLAETGQTFSTYTNSMGDFAHSFDPPLTPGLYHISGTVTDFTLTGTFSTEFVIQPAPCKPDLRCTVQMDAGSTIVGGTLNGSIKVVNSGCATSATSALLDVSGTLGTPIPADVVIPALEPGESFLYEFPAPVNFNTIGTASIQAISDASLIVVESNEQNNTCQASIAVRPDLPDIRIAYISGGGQRFQCRENGFTIRIENIGGVSTGAFQVERVVRRLIDDTVVYSDVVPINNIGSNGYVYSNLNHTFAQTGQYRIEVYADIPTSPQNGVITELNENNNTASIGLSLTECLPDLTLRGGLSVSPVDPHGNATVSLTAQLENHGNAPVAEDVTVRFQIGSNTVDVVHSGGLAVGQSVPVTAVLPSPGTDCAEVLILADAPGLITEVSEANNTQLSRLTYDFYLGNYCSFTTKKFWEKPQKVNQPVDFRVGLYNSGFFTASQVEVRFEISGPGISGWLDWGVSSLSNVGKTFSCPYVVEAATAYIFAQTGTYQVRMTVDPGGAYTECNESNNVFLVPVTVVEDRPDLRLLSQYIAPSKLNPDVGEPVYFDITYDNIGQNNIGDEFRLRWEVNEVVQDEVDAIGLNTGDHWTLSMPSSWSSTIPGIHIVRATIDSDEEIAEIDELNNSATRAILVGQYPNLYFDQVSVSETNPAAGDVIDLDFNIVNAGDLLCAADVQLFYVNDFGDSVLFETFSVQIPANDETSFNRNWQVLDPATTILFRIVNADPEEYDLTDNEYSLQLGQLAVSAAATGPESCPGSADGTASVSASGGQPPYLIQWSDGTAGSGLTTGAGTYQVTVTDQAGFSATAAVTIDAQPDDTPPLIFNGPGDITLTVTDGSCPVPVNWTAPEASDNCTLVSLESDHEPGESFPPGRTEVTYTARDQAGNLRTYSFDVIINAVPVALAGEDQLICGQEATLEAAIPGFGNGQWSVLEGNAVFENANDPMSSVSELAAGVNRLLWTVSNGSCGDATDELVIISDPAAYDFDGTHFAPPIPNEPNATLSANWEITADDGWTHYYQCAEDGGSGYLLLSVYKDGQDIGTLGNGLEVFNITVPNYGSNQAHDLSSADYVETDGWFVFGRYWDVHTTQEPVEPIRIRYYYSPEDTLALKQTIEMNGGVWDDDEAMRFFKVSGPGVGPFDLNVLAAGGNYLEYQNSSTPSLDTWTKGDFRGLMYAEYYVNSFSGGGGGGSPGPEGLLGALPLDLLSFTAERRENGTVHLNWSTINEFAVHGFQIQRSTSGVQWENIGWRDSQGDNTEVQLYAFPDEEAPAGILYYRLQMQDLDGTITYSPIVSVAGGVRAREVKIYPNPTGGTFQLLLEDPQLAGKQIRIRLSDAMGRILTDRQFEIDPSNSTVEIDALQFQPAGIYNLMISQDGLIREVMRIIKE